MNIQDEKMELWRRAANPDCDWCYGRGFVQRIVGDKKTGFKKMIDRCQCTEKKKGLAQRINDGDLEIKSGGGNG